MDIYHIWFDLQADADEDDFADATTAFLDTMEADGAIAGWRMTRCKLGLRPDAVPQFHIMIETEDLTQLDRAFKVARDGEGNIETLHFGSSSRVRNLKFGLYRDWPDA